MAASIVPHFANDDGAEKVRVGVKEFQCMGARPPFDHPHIFLDMGGDDQIICPYCSTLYIYDPSISAKGSDPTGCLVDADDDPVAQVIETA